MPILNQHDADTCQSMHGLDTYGFCLQQSPVPANCSEARQSGNSSTLASPIEKALAGSSCPVNASVDSLESPIRQLLQASCSMLTGGHDAQPATIPQQVGCILLTDLGKHVWR